MSEKVTIDIKCYEEFIRAEKTLEIIEETLRRRRYINVEDLEILLGIDLGNSPVVKLIKEDV